MPCVATGWLKELDLTRGSLGQALSQLQVGDVENGHTWNRITGSLIFDL